MLDGLVLDGCFLVASAATAAISASVTTTVSIVAAATAATTSVAIVATTAAAAASWAIFLWDSFIDAEGSAAELATVHGLYAGVKLVAFDVDKTKSTIWNDFGAVRLVVPKVHQQLGLSCREGQIAHE